MILASRILLTLSFEKNRIRLTQFGSDAHSWFGWSRLGKGWEVVGSHRAFPC